MPIARFTHLGSTRLGKVIGDKLVDLSVAAPELPRSLEQLLASGPAALERVKAIDGAVGAIPLAAVRLECPLPHPSKFLAIGMNFKAHAAEAAAAGIKTPTSQMWFNKNVNCITGPFDPVQVPKVSTQVDWEAELAVVIGQRCRHVSREQAPNVIAGYMVTNDVTVRDWQHRTPSYTLGKSFDTHGPIGPWLTLSSEIGNPHDLTITLTVNGEVKQHSKTDDMIYDIYDQIAYISQAMTLEPGDILATGTPSGVGIVTQTWLKPGDLCRVEISGLGAIENPIVNEI